MRKNLQSVLLYSGLAAALTFTGCSGGSVGSLPDLNLTFDLSVPVDLTPPADLTPPPDLAPPQRPLLGAQQDRLGRPLINLWLTAPFGIATTSTQAQVQDQYNAAAVQGWSAFAPSPYLAASLAAWDGIDGTCGNQILAGAVANSTRYQALSALLAYDVLLVSTEQTSCQSYLALERGVPADCGGRTPNINVVDVTLNLLQGGTPPATPLTTGVIVDPDGATSSAFPFLLPPT